MVDKLTYCLCIGLKIRRTNPQSFSSAGISAAFDQEKRKVHRAHVRIARVHQSHPLRRHMTVYCKAIFKILIMAGNSEKSPRRSDSHKQGKTQPISDDTENMEVCPYCGVILAKTASQKG